MRLIIRLLPALAVTSLVACVGKGDDDDDGEDTGDTGTAPVDADGDGFAEADDCDDADPAVNPDATEVCDGVDNNCDDAVDEGLLLTVYADTDGDGHGDDAAAVEACEVGADQAAEGGDCDDTDAAVNPDAEEVCDGLDNDCDGTVDNDDAADAPVWFADLDGDGFGDPENTTTACEQPSGFVSDATDCDDDAATVYPGADEICDGVDSDCDGTIGEVRVPTDHATLQAALDAEVPRICLEEGTHTGNVETTLTQDVTIEGVGAELAVLDGEGLGRTLGVELDGWDLTVSGLTVTGGWAEDDFAGGLLVTDGSRTGSLLVSDAVFTDNACVSETCLGAALTATRIDALVLRDVEAHGNTLEGAAYGTVTLFSGNTAELDGVHVHDEVTTAVDQGYSQALLLFGASETSAFTLNDVRVADNVASGEDGRVFSSLVVVGGASIDAANVAAHGNQMDVGWCVTPGMFSYEVAEGTYRNIDIRDNRCAAVDDAYTSGFWHLSEGGGTVVDVENMVVAGNRIEAGEEIYAGWMLDSSSTVTYTNVAITGNVASGAAPANVVGVAVTEGGGWTNYNGADVTLVNVDVSGNAISYTEGTATDFHVGESFSGGTPGTFSFTHSNLHDATFGDGITDPVGSGGNISAAPVYADVTATDAVDWDLTLDAGSPLIDAGDASILDPDGTTSDIGAHGGPGAADW